MRARNMPLLVIVLLLMPAVSLAQGETSDQRVGLTLSGLEQSILPGTSQGLSLLDPERFQMSQSYGVMYSYSSGQGKGNLLGIYQNQLSYRFSPRLNVQVGLGFLHRPLATFSENSAIRNQALMTAFQVDYRPFDNIFIRFSYQSLPEIGDRDLWRYRWSQ
jgi:hypothetical protein